MRFVSVLLGVALTAAIAPAMSCSEPARRPPRTRMTVKQVVEKSKPAIVRVEADGERVGTGFAVDPSGVIATNLHVVAGARVIRVKLLDGGTHDVKHVIGFDASRDLALLALELDRPMPHLTLGNSDEVSAGDPVIAIGNPLGVLDYTVSDGLISSVRVFDDGLTVLQISAPISQGSSGGPLFNPYGEVIGIATAIFTGGQNLNFAVPTNYLQPMIAAPQALSLDEFATATTFPDPHGGGAGPDGDDPNVKIYRQIPRHDVSVLDGCTQDDIAVVAEAISDAINLGAPLYNQGNFKACFKIYEGASVQMETAAKCAGVRHAFTAGLERAATLQTFKEKAWALRDTFDGLIEVMVRNAGGGVAPPAP